MTYDVITVGSATLDVYANTDTDKITIRDNEKTKEFIAYPCGSKILINHLNFYVGGGGTNTAATFSKMGLKTAYIGSLGEDSTLPQIMKSLKKDNIEFIGTMTTDQNDYSIILDSQDEDRTILNFKSASEKLRFGKLNKDLMKAKWFYFSSFTNGAFLEAQKIAKYAKDKGSKIAFNPSSYITKKGPKYVEKMLSLTNILILNDEEASMLTGNCMDSLEKLKKLKDFGPNIVIITNGKKGVEAIYDNTHYKSGIYDVKVVETTGAGDAFASAFVACFEKSGQDFEFALKMGLANASGAVSYIGPKEKIYTYFEAKRFIEKTPISIQKHKI